MTGGRRFGVIARDREPLRFDSLNVYVAVVGLAVACAIGFVMGVIVGKFEAASIALLLACVLGCIDFWYWRLPVRGEVSDFKDIPDWWPRARGR